MSEGGERKTCEREGKHTTKESMGVQHYWLLLLLLLVDCRERRTGSVVVECAEVCACVCVCIYSHCTLNECVGLFVVVQSCVRVSVSLPVCACGCVCMNMQFSAAVVDWPLLGSDMSQPVLSGMLQTGALMQNLPVMQT